YSQLRERSGSLASALQSQGISKGDRVAVLGHGGAETICALVGVLRAGPAIVPIDGDLETGRVQALLAAARVSAVIRCDDAALPPGLEVPVVHPSRVGAQPPGISTIPEPLQPAW